MVDINAVRQRLGHYLSRITAERVVGVGGLAVLSAASSVALIPSSDLSTFASIASQWLGTLGLNVLAGVLYQSYHWLLTQPSKDEMDQLIWLASSLAKDIENQPVLRREVRAFLDNVNAFEIAQEVVKGNPAIHGWLLVKIYQDVIQYRDDFDQIHHALAEIKRLVEERGLSLVHTRPFTVPPMPSIFIGREESRRSLLSRLGISPTGLETASIQPQTILQGWPGVGKTSLATILAYDPDVALAFPDGVLWVSLGPAPKLLSEIAIWGQALGTDALMGAQTLDEARSLLAGLLLNKRVLLIIDDVYDPQHAMPFNAGGPKCATLITTRFPEVADFLTNTPAGVYKLTILSDEKALELLKILAPEVVQQYPQESLELVHELEGLPLALQVAGRLLSVEFRLGFSVNNLIDELREGAKLLEAKAPKDRIDLKLGTSPTVATLLQQSFDHLDSEAQYCFAFLGAFAPKPATFEFEDMEAVWGVQNPKGVVRKLVAYGLLEPVPPRLFQMHAVLVMYARSLLKNDEE